MKTTSRKPESVSSVNITPLAPRSERTMYCMPADSATCVVLEALVHAIGDRAIVEERGEHFVDALEQRIAAAHVEERFLLAGERGVRQILGGRRGAHGDGDLAPAAHALEAIRGSRARAAAGTASPGSSRGSARRRRRASRRRRRRASRAPWRCVPRGRRAAGSRDTPARSSRSRRAPRRRAFARWLIISPSEEFLPPTVSTS